MLHSELERRTIPDGLICLANLLESFWVCRHLECNPSTDHQPDNRCHAKQKQPSSVHETRSGLTTEVSHRRSRQRWTVNLHIILNVERCGCWLHRLVGPDYPCSGPDLVILLSFPGTPRVIGVCLGIACTPARDLTPYSMAAPHSERRCILAPDAHWLKTGAHTLCSRGPTTERSHAGNNGVPERSWREGCPSSTSDSVRE
jgi:hypothetical protein